MKVIVTIKDLNKLDYLDSCLMSSQAKQIGNNVEAWYYAKKYWLEDKKQLEHNLGHKVTWTETKWWK